jgi:hypothetical protein
MPKAQVVHLRCDKAVVVVSTERESESAIITVSSGNSRGLAEGIARMINQSQCSVCGKFNGLHGEVFHGTGQSGGGEVTGYFKMCPVGQQEAQAGR